eukprot:s494_g5.t1
MVVWLLSSLLTAWFGVRFAWPWYMTIKDTVEQSFVVSHLMATRTAFDFMAHAIVGCFPIFVCQTPEHTVTALAFTYKARQNDIMLEHFSNFDVRNAQSLYDQIARFFDGIDETPISIEFGAPESFGEPLSPASRASRLSQSGAPRCVGLPATQAKMSVWSCSTTTSEQSFAARSSLIWASWLCSGSKAVRHGLYHELLADDLHVVFVHLGGSAAIVLPPFISLCSALAQSIFWGAASELLVKGWCTLPLLVLLSLLAVSALLWKANFLDPN